MAKVVLCVFVFAGIAFTALSIWCAEENKKMREYEKYKQWREKQK